MEINHDFEADNRFFIDNYGTLLSLYSGKTVAIANGRVLYVADSLTDAVSWSKRFCMDGRCSILEVSPKTYLEKTEGIVI